MRNYLNTLDDMLKLYYSNKGAKFIQKSDAPVLSTTTGFYNPKYGAEVWRQLNQTDTAFGLLPKSVWNRSGWRAITARANAITTPTGGMSEGGALNDTVKPTLTNISTKPKEVGTNFEVSSRQDFLSKVRDDDSVGDLEFMKAYMGIEHKEHIDAMLLKDVDTLAVNNFESIDRVVSSNSEVANCGITAGDSDIYGLDRDAGTTWTDAYVNHNSGADRALTDALIRTLITNVKTNGGKISYLLTGYDTYSKIQSLYADQARYINPMKDVREVTVNGVGTVKGIDAGIELCTIYGIPLFQDPHVAVDTISRIYALDTGNPENFDLPRLSFKVAQPTSYYESRDFFSVGKLSHEGMYLTSGELVCTFFAAQGKLRDLST